VFHCAYVNIFFRDEVSSEPYRVLFLILFLIFLLWFRAVDYGWLAVSFRAHVNIS